MADIKSEEVGEKKSLNFIEQIVEKDLKEGKNGGKIMVCWGRLRWIGRRRVK